MNYFCLSSSIGDCGSVDKDIVIHVLTQFVSLFIKSCYCGGGMCIASIWRLRHKCVEPVLYLDPHVGPGD